MTAETHSPAMIDLLFLGITAVFFIAAGLYAHACETL